MEQPPSTSDSLQPQDLSSSCSLPNIFDLAKNSEECLLKTNPIDALNVVQTPSWFVSPGTSNGILLPDSDSDAIPFPTEQIQPDDAFSNTTVTLSYVSRSHLFSNHNNLAEHSQIYGVPSLGKAFALHPAVYEASKLATDSIDPALLAEMDQQCLHQVSVPVGLTACDQFGFMSPELAALCYLQQQPDISQLEAVENMALETLKSLQTDTTGCRFPINMEDLQNGALNGLWNVGPFQEAFPEDQALNAEELHKNDKPEVVFLLSRAEEPVILQNNQEPVNLATSLNQDFINPLNPQSPLAASVGDIQGGFSMPQAASSPSRKLLCDEEDPACGKQEDLDEEEFDPTTDQQHEGSSETLHNIERKPSLSSDEVESDGLVQDLSLSSRTTSTDAVKMSNGLSFNGCSKKKVERKELPLRVSRGMRMGAIVQNIYTSRDKSDHFSNRKKTQKQLYLDCHRKSLPNTTNQSKQEETCSVQEPSKRSEKITRCLRVVVTDVRHSNRCKTTVSTSPFKSVCVAEPSVDEPAKKLNMCLKSTRKTKMPQPLVDEPAKKVKANLSSTKKTKLLQQIGPKTSSKSSQCSRPVTTASKRKLLTKKSKSSSKEPPKQGPKPTSTKKNSHITKRKKKHKVASSSFFLPPEPEIKFKYVNYTSEKKELRNESFTPYVHMDLKNSKSCRVINYPEENVQLKKGKQSLSTCSGVLPATPFLQFGRVSMNGSQRGTLVCCLCGGSANAMDLGDLHGPYYPEGFKAASKTNSSPQDDDNRDSDSSFRETGVAFLPRCWTKSPSVRSRTCSGESELSSSSAVKRPVTDWYSAPLVPLEASEYWLHEDCCIWSAGVYLVRGKLYGLENAVRLAKESICSRCEETGATLGCVFKGCPSKYHYMCALKSGCVLSQENYSMNCRKHKNKSIIRSSCHHIGR